MARFDLAVGKTLWLEGNDTYVNDPDDPGGETIYGITRRDHPDLWADGPPTRERAIERYRRDYWKDLYDRIEDQEVASELMEFGVVAGPATAVRKLQQAINACSMDYRVKEDGVFGSATLTAVNGLDPVRLLRWFRTEQIIRAVKLGEARPALKKFMRQWIWRALA